ncbi:MAG: Hsp33 family molecular chaperone [Pseudomonadota bacterium]
MTEKQSPEIAGAADALVDDVVVPFQVADTAVRGRLVRLAGGIDDILRPHQFPDEVSELVGEATALAAMMGSALKFDGKLIFQAQGDGPVKLVVADFLTSGDIRAMASFDAGAAPLPRGAAALLGKGHMAFTIDQGAEMDRYQGVTGLDGDNLAAMAVAYFAQSEQIPTVVKLAVGRASTLGGDEVWRAGGIMVQFVPDEGGNAVCGEGVDMDAGDDDVWTRLSAFVETTQADELLDPSISPSTLLLRLFHEDGVRVFDPVAIRAACGCSGEKIATVLKKYSTADLAEMVEDGIITVTCEFCRAAYRFSPEGVMMDTL